jgi:BMFP domain-containing protein YqiC
MTTTSSRLFDELAKLMGNAAGTAQGVRREIDLLVKAQVERVLGDLAVVQREEFDAVREMAERAREENEQLKARIASSRQAGAPSESQASLRHRTVEEPRHFGPAPLQDCPLLRASICSYRLIRTRHIW